MAAEYNERGIRFQFPENWQLAVDDSSGWPRSVSVYAPGGAFWSVTVDCGPAADLLERVVAAIRQEYEECEAEAIVREIGNRRLVGVELNFYCLDLLVTAQVLQVAGAPQPTVLLLQAESRDFEQLADVFNAISFSYLQQLAALAVES